MPPDTELTELQRRFVEHYCADPTGNATAAAIAAGYSPRSARNRASKNLSHPGISRAIRKVRDPARRKYKLTPERIARELATVALSDHTDYVLSDDGQLSLAPNAPKRAARAISQVKRQTRVTRSQDGAEVTEHRVEFRLWPKVQALDLAMQYLKMKADGVAITNTGPQVWIVGGRPISF